MTRIPARVPLSDRKRCEVFLYLTRTLIRHAHGEMQESTLLDEISRMLLDRFRCEAVEIWFGRGPGCCRYGVYGEGQSGYLPPPMKSCRHTSLGMSVLSGDIPPSLREYTQNGYLWMDDLWETAPCPSGSCAGAQAMGDCRDRSWRSLAVMPLGKGHAGILVLAGLKPAWFRPEEAPFLVDIAGIIGMGITIQQRQEALGERIKELTCLYGLSRLAQGTELPLGDLLRGVADLVLPAWQHPECAHCRITYAGNVFESGGFVESRLRQAANIYVKGEHQGEIEVFYREDAPWIDEGNPFLPEERNLIEGLAREVSLMIERRQLDKDRDSLWEQLQHMDRLATIGQLTASVAHELNEPLCSILGLAQLAIKDQELSPQSRRDINKIIASSLHARDVVKSLLTFSRPAPARKESTALNRIIEEVVDLFTARCARAKVAVHRELEPGLPEITADPSQIHQVLVNLIVNAIQAMPEGGVLTLGTRQKGARVQLSVADSGIGMNDDMIQQVFVPFFTTKEVGHGTGLGLGIVRNIVTTHGGTIAVESRPGEGSRFIIELQMAAPEGIADEKHDQDRTGSLHSGG